MQLSKAPKRTKNVEACASLGRKSILDTSLTYCSESAKYPWHLNFAARYENVKILLVLVLALSSVAYGSGPQGSDSDRPKLQLEQPGNLDIPRNCRTTIEKDDSVLLTCECENCGQPDSSDGSDPVPWTCKSGEGGLYCSYDIDTQTSGERKHSR